MALGFAAHHPQRDDAANAFNHRRLLFARGDDRLLLGVTLEREGDGADQGIEREGGERDER